MSGIMAAASVGWDVLVVTCAGIDAGGGTSTITTPAADGAARGGTGSYSFAWTFVSGDSSIIVMNATDPHSAFRGQGLFPDDSVSGVFRLTATDALGGQTATVDVTVTITRDSRDGGGGPLQ